MYVVGASSIDAVPVFDYGLIAISGKLNCSILSVGNICRRTLARGTHLLTRHMGGKVLS